jgi:hypothetical protein
MHLSRFLGIGKIISGLFTAAFFLISLKLALEIFEIKNDITISAINFFI